MKTLRPLTGNFMESRPGQSMPTHLEHDLNFNSWRALALAPRSVGMLEHLDSTHPGSMSILSTASLLAVEALLPLCVLKRGLKKRRRKC